MATAPTVNEHNRKGALRNKRTSFGFSYVSLLGFFIAAIFLESLWLNYCMVAPHHEDTMHSDSLGQSMPVPQSAASDSGLVVPVVPVVHVVSTRFMQGQGDLAQLAAARLELFETFCLPTMISQTTQNFVWMVRTDPALDGAAKERMIELLAPHPNYLLVASNDKPWDFKGWFDGTSSQADFLEDSSKLWTGDANLVREAQTAIPSSVVLETNLDADDGLNRRYIERVQEQAVESLGGRNGFHRWKYWCVTGPLQWHPAPPELHGSHLPGRILPDEEKYTCKTPGLTSGTGRKTRTAPRKKDLNKGHLDLLNKYPLCSKDPKTGLHAVPNQAGCIYDMNLGPHVLWPNAIRARTTTSNGMMDIGNSESLNSSYETPFGPLNQTGLWGLVQRELFISPGRAKNTQKYLSDNLGSIAIENLKGQCRNGDDYSCKDNAKKILSRIVNRAAKEQVISTVDESPVSTLEEKRMNVRGTKSERVKRKATKQSSRIANGGMMVSTVDEFNDLPSSTLVSMLKEKGMRDRGTKSDLVRRLVLRQSKADDLAAGRLDLAVLTKPELRELKNSLGAGADDGKTSRTMPQYIRLLTECLA